MKSTEATKVIREAVAYFLDGAEGQARSAVKDLKDFGFVYGEYVGSSELLNSGIDLNVSKDLTEEQKIMSLKWYAGQIIQVVEDEKWFAMNAICNTNDKFAPEEWL